MEVKEIKIMRIGIQDIEKRKTAIFPRIKTSQAQKWYNKYQINAPL